jgi:hypothetical protein
LFLQSGDFDAVRFFDEIKRLGGDELQRKLTSEFRRVFFEPAIESFCLELNERSREFQEKVALLNPLSRFLRFYSAALEGFVSDLEDFELVFFGNRIRIPESLIFPLRNFSDSINGSLDALDDLIEELVNLVDKLFAICEVE